MRLQHCGSEPVEQKLLCGHAVVGKEAHKGKGRSTQHTEPGYCLGADMGRQTEIEGNSHGDCCQRKEKLPQRQAEEHTLPVVANLLVDFDFHNTSL